MKKCISLLGIWGIVAVANAQQSELERRVGVNTETPQATLDITKNTALPATAPQGVLFPNFTIAERGQFVDIKEGTMIYNTTERCWEIYTIRNEQPVWQCMSF